MPTIRNFVDNKLQRNQNTNTFVYKQNAIFHTPIQHHQYFRTIIHFLLMYVCSYYILDRIIIINTYYIIYQNGFVFLLYFIFPHFYSN